MSTETKEISDQDFENLFLEDSPEVKQNAFNRTAEKSDVDKLLDFENVDSKKTPEELEEQKKKDEEIDKLLDNSLQSSEDKEEDDNNDITSTSVYKAVESLVEEGTLQVFVDDDGKPLKDLKDYTVEELTELISDNIDTAIESTATNAPVELFKTFPKAVQDVISYTISGGKEEQLKGLFLQLAQVQETLDLNPEDEKDARKIIKQYLELENLHTEEEIEDQITKIEDLGKLSDYGTKYKKVLDTKQAAVLQKRIADQEILAKQKQQVETALNNKFYETLKEPFADLDLDVETRKSLYHGLVVKKHQNEKGEPINELEHLIRQKSLGTQDDAKLLVKAFAYLKSPETFVSSLEKQIRAKIQKELTNELKDSNSRNATTSVNTNTENSRKKLSGLPKKTNFFAR